MDEPSLIRRALAGDAAAERALFDLSVGRIYRVIFRMTEDPGLADDFTQDTFVRAFDRLSTFRGDSSFSTWITRIAVTVTLNGLEKVRRQRQREVALSPGIHDRQAAPTGEIFLMGRIQQALRSLPDRQRAVMAMHGEGYTHEEIAMALNISVAASKTRLSRARERLREQLGDVLEEFNT